MCQTVDANAPLGTDLLSVAFRLIDPQPVNALAVFLGASRAAGAASALQGWGWLDGTPSDNINPCNATECSIFSPGEPGWVLVPD